MKGRQYFLPASHAGTVEVLVFMYMANTLWLTCNLLRNVLTCSVYLGT